MKILFITGLLIFSVLTKAQNNIRLDQPPANPALFAKGVISTGNYERDFALSPDGNEIFYTLQSPLGVFQTILYVKKDLKGRWGKPEVAPFAGKYRDLEPAFAPDGNKLFFSSNRPVSGNEPKKDIDIWYVEKENGKWGQPKNPGAPVNGPMDEYYPSITKTGNLYFTAAYSNAHGKEDIYIARWENGKYLDPVPLDTAVNSSVYEFNAFVSPDEQFILFTSYGRKDDKGRGDLYMSVKDANNAWQPAFNLSMLNSDRLDYCPFVSFDKKLLFFTSEQHALKGFFPDKAVSYSTLKDSFSAPLNGNGDIYWVSFEEFLKTAARPIVQ